MEVEVYDDAQNYDGYVLAGDVGGTNVNLAVVGRRQGKFVPLAETIISSKEVQDFTPVVVSAVEGLMAKLGDRPVDQCCISAAGPVENNRCQLTNRQWAVDGDSIEKSLGMPTIVVNDFLALSYGIPLLDLDNPQHIRCLAPENEPRTGGQMMVLGAGTGLGFGYLTLESDGYRAHPSEGGHVDFAPSCQEEAEMAVWWAARLGEWPSAERFVAGPGIGRIFEFLHARGEFGSDAVAEEVAALPESERAPRVAADAGIGGKTGVAVMRRFVKIYGKFAGSMANAFLPYGGVYVAGGIVGKNIDLFVDDNAFMREFRRNDTRGSRKYLGEFPVYAVLDYSISLVGAANAGLHLLGSRK